MILYQKELKSKELTSYIDFLKRMKELGSSFLVKGDVWVPSEKNDKNTPGIHIGKDPLLHEYYTQEANSVYTKFTCCRLEDTLASIAEVKGRKTLILLEITQDELSLYINDTQWVIASKFIAETTPDLCPEINDFDSYISSYDNWYDFSDETLQALIDSHPVTVYGTIDGTDEKTPVRLAKKLMKLRGVGCRKLDHSGQYTITKSDQSVFDDSVCKLIMHMKYTKIECINIYYIRKY